MTAREPSGSAGLTSNFLKHTHANPILRMLIDRFHERVVKHVQALQPGSFLDAGCGEGFVSSALLRELPGLQICGFDFNPASVALAQQANREGFYCTSSIYEIPFPDRSFDVVGCFEVLEHLTEPTRALRELARVARRYLLLSVPHEPFFSLSNAARGKNLDIRPRGSDPDHRQFWTHAAFGRFVGQVAEVDELDGSFPWTICVARPRSGF